MGLDLAAAALAVGLPEGLVELVEVVGLRLRGRGDGVDLLLATREGVIEGLVMVSLADPVLPPHSRAEVASNEERRPRRIEWASLRLLLISFLLSVHRLHELLLHVLRPLQARAVVRGLVVVYFPGVLR